MKSNRGITLISLTIYVIVLSIVIGTISMVTKYFYNNTKGTITSGEIANQYSRFVAYITDDVNSRENRKCKFRTGKY